MANFRGWIVSTPLAVYMKLSLIVRQWTQIGMITFQKTYDGGLDLKFFEIKLKKLISISLLKTSESEYDFIISELFHGWVVWTPSVVVEAEAAASFC